MTIYSIRFPGNSSLKKIIMPQLHRPAFRPPKDETLIEAVEFDYQAEKRSKARWRACNQV